MQENTLGALLPEMRLDFWESLWEGQFPNAAAMERRLKLLDLPVTADTPCCRCVLRLVHGDAYLEQRWRYGKNRLRVAVGNLLPHETDDVLYGVCRLTPRHVYILACAKNGMNAEELEAHTRQDIQKLIDMMETYLELQSELKEIVSLESLTQLLNKSEQA